MSDSVRSRRRQHTRLCHPWDSPGKNTGVGCHFLLQCMKVKSEREVTQSCSTLSDPMDCSPPGSSIHGIFQARVLEWGAIVFSNLQKAKQRPYDPAIPLLVLYSKEMKIIFTQKLVHGAFLVVQWLGIRLTMQETQVQSLFQEDPTCHGATKPVCHNF